MSLIEDILRKNRKKGRGGEDSDDDNNNDSNNYENNDANPQNNQNTEGSQSTQFGEQAGLGDAPTTDTDFGAILDKLYDTKGIIPDKMANILPSLFNKNNVLGYWDRYTELTVIYTAMSSAVSPIIFSDPDRFGEIPEVENLKLQDNFIIATLAVGKRAESGFGAIPVAGGNVMSFANLERGKKSIGESIKNLFE